MTVRTSRTLSSVLAGFIIVCATQARAEETLTIVSPVARHVFLEGESIELAVALRAETAEEDTLAVSLAEADREQKTWKLHERGLTPKPGTPAHMNLLVTSRTTSMLRPGLYRVEAAFGDLRAEPYELEIVSAARQTNYPVVSWQHTGYWRHVAKLEGTPGRTDRGRRTQGGLEYNVSHFGANLAPSAGRPEDLLRRGIAYLPSMYPGDRHVGIPEYMAQQARRLEILAQKLRRFPNFVGISMLAQDEFVSWGDLWLPWGASEKDIRKRTGFLSSGISQWHRPSDRELTRYLIWQEFRLANNLPDETVHAVPFTSRAFEGLVSARNPALYLRWMEFLHGTVTNRMQEFYRASIDRFAPNILMSTNRYLPLSNQYIGYTLYNAARPRIYCALDPSMSCGGIDVITIDPDGYDRNNEPYEAAVLPDLLETQRVRGKPVWKIGYGTQGFGFFAGRQQLLRDCLMPIARGAVPATSESFEKGEAYLNNSDEWPHVGYGNRERYSLISGFLKSYGDMFLRLEKEKDVAVLFSHAQDMLSAKEKLAHGFSLWQISVSAFMAHVPSVFISEQDILRGELQSHKVLLLTKLDTELPRDVIRGIQRFIDAGGIVIADAKTDLPLKGMERLDTAFDAYLNYMMATYYEWKLYAGPRPEVRSEWYGLRQEALKTMPPLKKALVKHLPRLVDCRNPDVFLATSTCGRMKVVFCVNYTPEAYGWKTEEDATFSEPDTPRPVNQNSMDATWVHPLVERLYFQRGDYRIYDLFAQKQVKPRRRRGKWVVDADMRALEGRIYVLLPEAVDRVELSATQSVRAGSLIRVHVDVVGSSGENIDGAVPIEILVHAPDGSEFYRYYRAAGADGWDENVKIALNDATGTWRVAARELLSGRTASVEVTVTEPGAEALLTLSARERTDPVIISDHAHITRFLAEQNRVAIFLDEAQAGYRELAEKLQAGLAGRGIDARIVTDLDEILVGSGRDIRTMEMDAAAIYKRKQTKEGGTTPEIRVPLVLMGLPGDNHLIEQLNGAHVALRQFGPDYPPRGTALLQHVFSAFAPKVNVVLLQATDRMGLETAVDTLIGLGEPKHVEFSSIEKARYDMLPADFKRYREAQLGKKLPTALDLPVASGELTSRGMKRGQTEQALFAERIGVPIYAIAFSPDGSRIAVGTDARVGPGERDDKNLFVLDSNGNIRAKGQANEHLIGKVAITRGGKRVFASVQMSGTLEIFDAALRPLKKHDVPVYPGYAHKWGDYDAAYFHLASDEETIFRVAKPSRIVAESMATGKVIWSHDFAPKDDSIEELKYRLAAFALSPDGSRIGIVVRQDGVPNISMHQPGDVKMWITMLDASNGNVISEWTGTGGQDNGWMWRHEHANHGGWPAGTMLAFSRDGKIAAMPSNGNTLSLHDGSGDEVAKIACRAPQRVLFTPDGRRLISYWIVREAPLRGVVDKYHLTFYDMDGHKVIASASGRESVSDADISPDGKMVAALWWDGTVRAYDVDGNELWNTFIGTGGRAKFGPDGQVILVGTWAGRVAMLDASHGRFLWKKELPRE